MKSEMGHLSPESKSDESGIGLYHSDPVSGDDEADDKPSKQVC